MSFFTPFVHLLDRELESGTRCVDEYIPKFKASLGSLHSVSLCLWHRTQARMTQTMLLCESSHHRENSSAQLIYRLPRAKYNDVIDGQCMFTV